MELLPIIDELMTLSGHQNSECQWNWDFINASARRQFEHNELKARPLGHLSIMAH